MKVYNEIGKIVSAPDRKLFACHGGSITISQYKELHK